ncbi:MAG TPA: hypothetical protein PK760_11910, partial [Flavobacteriales bacterium]|nr:hypothetical protein [Flavobacteriales bacterium]
MLRKFLIAASVVAPLFSIAQTGKAEVDKVKVKVRVSPEQKPDGTMTPYATIRSTPTTIMVMRSPDFSDKAFTKQEPRLDLYDREKLTHLRSMEPAMFRLKQDRLLLQDLIMFGGKPTLIARSGTESEVGLFYQNVDPHLVRQPPAFERLCTFPVEVKERRAANVINEVGRSTSERWSTVIASDSAHLLVHSPELRGREDGDAFYLMAMLDRNMQVLWQQILRVSGGSSRSDVLDAVVD